MMHYAFTDGSPFYEVAAFLTLFFICLQVVRVPAIAAALDRAIVAVTTFLRRRGLFTSDDPAFDQWRLNLVRIGIGALACWRAGLELASAIQSGDAQLAALQSGALSLSVMLLIGFATPVAAALLLVLLNLIIDNMSLTSNLGSMVTAMILIVLAVAPAGRTLSLDARLLPRPDWVGQQLRRLYELVGPFTLDRSAMLRACALLCYALVAFYSGLMHLQSDVWTSGLLTAWLMLAPTSNPNFHGVADWFYREWAVGYVTFSQISTYLLLAWFVGMIPFLLLHRWSRRFVIVWGALFFANAAFIVPVRLVGYIEFALWILVFWNRPPALPFSWKRAEIALPSEPNHGPRRPLLHAIVLSVAILSIAYTARMPLKSAVATTAASASKAIFGQAPIVFGLGPIDVLNERDIEALRRTFRVWWSNSQDATRLRDPSFLIKADSFYFITMRFIRVMSNLNAFCGEDLVDQFLARRFTHVVQHSEPPGSPRLHVKFYVADFPTSEDFASYRYVPVRHREVCEVVVDAATFDRVSVTALATH